MPYSNLARSIANDACRARTIAARTLQPERKTFTEIDEAATHGLIKKFSKEDCSYLRTVQSGGGWDKVSIQA